MSNRKPIVYIMSPYTKGDPCINTHCQIKMFNELMDDGIVIPFIPLASHFLHTCYPRPYKDWIKTDLGYIHVMDAGLRIVASNFRMNYYEDVSSGADGEEALFVELGKPVFRVVSDLYNWVESEWNNVDIDMSQK